MKNNMKAKMSGGLFLVVLTALGAHCVAGSEYELPYDSSEGLSIKNSYTGLRMNPYSHTTPGGGMKQLVGGLFFKLDLTPKQDMSTDWPRLHVRTVPGYQHYGHLIQGTWVGINWTIRASYFDLGAFYPPGATNPKTVARANNWASFAVGFDYTEGAVKNTKGFVGLALDDEEIADEKPEEDDPVFDLMNNPAAKLAVVVSRLTPAIMVSAKSSSITLFGGPQWNWRNTPGRGDYNWSITGEKKAPVRFAIRTGDGATLHDLSSPAGEAPDFYQAKENWMLCWWGDADILSTTAMPDPDAAGDAFLIPYRNRFKPGDCPCLVVFQNEPLGAEAGADGGMELHFAGPAGRIVVLPLLGALFQGIPAKTGLAKEIIEQADHWADRLCAYPYKIKETFTYDRTKDIVTVLNRFHYLAVREGGKKAAPVPPMLALAKKYGFGVGISPAPAAPAIVTSAGPYVCVEGDNVSYSVSGLDKYLSGCRMSGGASAVAAGLERELNEKIEEILDAGVLAPAPLFPRGPHFYAQLEWSNPAETIYYISQALPLLDETLRARALEYLEEFMCEHPLLEPHWLGTGMGKSRMWGAELEKPKSEPYSDYEKKKHAEHNFFLKTKTVPPFNLYALDNYLRAGGKFDAKENFALVTNALYAHLGRADWASMGWYSHAHPKNDDRIDTLYGNGGIVDANGWFAGTLGYARLAERAGDEEAVATARYLFAKAAIHRFALEKMVTFCHDTGRLKPPDDPFWILKRWVRLDSAGNRGERVVQLSSWYPIAMEWRGPEDDIRPVSWMDELGVTFMGISHLYMDAELVRYRDMIPELARFLKDFCFEENKKYLHHLVQYQPDWYAAYGDAVHGTESSWDMPANSYQTFLAHAWILDAPADDLRLYRDVPWVKIGDYYYLHKLAESIKTYQGWKWK